MAILMMMIRNEVEPAYFQPPFVLVGSTDLFVWLVGMITVRIQSSCTQQRSYLCLCLPVCCPYWHFGWGRRLQDYKMPRPSQTASRMIDMITRELILENSGSTPSLSRGGGRGESLID